MSIAVEQRLDHHFGHEIGQCIGFKKTLVDCNAINTLLKEFQMISNILVFHDLDSSLKVGRVQSTSVNLNLAGKKFITNTHVLYSLYLVFA